MVFVPNLVEGELPLEGAHIEEVSSLGLLLAYPNPHPNPNNPNPNNPSQERRLAYVALSRAKTRLCLSHAARDASGQPSTP